DSSVTGVQTCALPSCTDRSREEVEMRLREERPGIDRYDFLEPTRPQPVIRKAELRAAAAFLEPDLQRIDQSQEQGVAQEPQIAEGFLGADVSVEGPASLPGEELRPGGLADIAAGQPEHLFEQKRVAFAAAVPDPQVVPDDPADHGLVELVRQTAPVHV